MGKVMSATDVRVHFGEVMRHVVERNEPVVVEKSGTPQVVVISFADFERWQQASQLADFESTLAQILAFGNSIYNRNEGHALPAPEEMIRQTRRGSVCIPVGH